MIHKRKWSKEDKERVAAYARSGVNVTALAERFETSRGHIYRVLKEMGV